MNFEIALSFEQSPWQPEKYLGIPCRPSLDISAVICPCLGTERLPQSATDLMNVFAVLRRRSTDVILLALGDPCKSFVLCHCNAVSTNEWSHRVSGADSVHGCTGSFSVPRELYERVTSVTRIVLVLEKCLSPSSGFLLWIFTTLTYVLQDLSVLSSNQLETVVVFQ